MSAAAKFASVRVQAEGLVHAITPSVTTGEEPCAACRLIVSTP